MLARLTLWLRLLVDCSSFMLAVGCSCSLCWWDCRGIWKGMDIVYSGRESCTFKSMRSYHECITNYSTNAFVFSIIHLFIALRWFDRRINADVIRLTGIRISEKRQKKKSFSIKRRSGVPRDVAIYRKIFQPRCA